MSIGKFNYYCPSGIKEAQELIASLVNVKLLAGGTWLLNLLKKNSSLAQNIVSLKGIKELGVIEKQNDAVYIGPMVTLDDLGRNSVIRNNLSVLADCSRKAATAQIRNMATVGGNVGSCLPWTDLSCVLAALDAEFTFVGKGKVPCENFFLNPKKYVQGDILEKIVVPSRHILDYKFIRLPLRNNTDIPFGSLCLIKEEERVSFSANLGNHYPVRFKTVEKYLNNQGRDKKELIKLFSDGLSCYQKNQHRFEVMMGMFSQLIESYG